jgi:cbb3-type cytochrome oxidase subunit 3
MIKDILRDAGIEGLAATGLVLLFVVFASMCVWVLLRRKREVERWAHLPLDDDGTDGCPSGQKQADTPLHGANR